MAAAMIAKAILGAIGGGFEGAAKPYSGGGDKGVKAADSSAAASVGSNTEAPKAKEEASTLTKEDAQTISNVQQVQSNQQAPTNQAFNAGNLSNIGEALKNFKSDIRLKEIYGDNISDSIIRNFAKIAAIDFKYTKQAQEDYKGKNGVDDKEHIGVKAQELEKNPATKGTVNTDEKGNLEVNVNHLTAANTAAIAELSRRVLAIEEIIKKIEGAK